MNVAVAKGTINHNIGSNIVIIFIDFAELYKSYFTL
jgi:hypothetical protein